MSDQQNFSHQITVEQIDQRIDRICADLWPEFSRARLQSFIKNQDLLVNGQAIATAYKTKLNDLISLTVPVIIDAAPQAQHVEFNIIFEDDWLLVINKPVGLVVHPGAGNPDHTLVNGLIDHCQDSLSGIGGVKRPGIVHRLDKGTSGLMVVAKTDLAHQHLSKQFNDRSLTRRYQAIIWGVINPFDGTIEGNIGRDFHHRQKMKVQVHGGKPAITDYKLIERVGSRASLVQCSLRTGRTHQIRVHLSSKGHGLIGDPLYGAPPRGVNPEIIHTLNTLTQYKTRPCLHAEHITFIHPGTNKTMRFSCPWPDDLAEIYRYLQTV